MSQIDVTSAGRNLNIVSGAIIVYLLSGASVGEFSVLGVRMPLHYPQVVELAALTLFAWLAYQYILTARKPFAKMSEEFYETLQTNPKIRE